MFLVCSRDHVSWFRLDGSELDMVRSLTNDGQMGPLYPLHDTTQAVLQIRRGPIDSWLSLVDEFGFSGRPIAIPFHGFYQVTSSLSGSLLAGFGTVSALGKLGYLEPVESCLIDFASGALQRLPYSAVAIEGDVLYFVKDRIVYRKKLAFQRFANEVDSTFVGDPLEVMASDRVLHVVPKDGNVWLATEHGLFAANSLDVDLVHKWDFVGRVRVCGDVFFAAGIGTEVQIYDTRNGIASSVTSSSKTQVTDFDVFSLSPGEGSAQGLLMMASEKGVLDCFCWSSSNRH